MSEPVDYSLALATINDIKDSLGGMVRSIIVALRDGNMSMTEKLMLGMKGMNLAVTLTAFIQEGTAEERAMVLYVLEQGKLTMDGK